MQRFCYGVCYFYECLGQELATYMWKIEEKRGKSRAGCTLTKINSSTRGCAVPVPSERGRSAADAAACEASRGLFTKTPSNNPKTQTCASRNSTTTFSLLQRAAILRRPAAGHGGGPRGEGGAEPQPRGPLGVVVLPPQPTASSARLPVRAERGLLGNGVRPLCSTERRGGCWEL